MAASIALQAHHPRALLLPFAWPLCYGALWLLLGIGPLGGFSNPAAIQLEYAPLARTASLFGLQGIGFVLSLAASFAELHLLMPGALGTRTGHYSLLPVTWICKPGGDMCH